MTNNVGTTFIVGDTILWLTISIEQDNLDLVTLNIVFTVKPVDSSLRDNRLKFKTLRNY